MGQSRQPQRKGRGIAGTAAFPYADFFLVQSEATAGVWPGNPNACLPRLNMACPNSSRWRELLGFRVMWPDRPAAMERANRLHQQLPLG
jgi:hypothetical protein